MVSLMAFATSAYFIFKRVEVSQYDSVVVDKSAPLFATLLPEVGSSNDTYDAALKEIGGVLEMNITLYDEDRALLATSDFVSPIGATGFRLGDWEVSQDQLHWTTQLSDGRWIVVDLEEPPETEELRTLIMVLFATAIVLILVMYPFIRSLTARLETLQRAAVRVGSGKLRTRVDVRGNDEVASVAKSFNGAVDQIEKLVSSQRLLLANTSHELRTPLARVQLGLDLVESDVPPEQYRSIKKDIRELDELIDELLLLSRFDAPDFRMTVGEVDLVALSAEECAHYVGCQLASEIVPRITGDQKMIRRLLRNLLDNAEKHGAQPISVELSERAGFVDLIVSDKGPGISMSDRTHVFDAFYRASHRQNTPGHGLGLALVKSIADAHNADIKVTAEPGFSITISFPVRTTSD